MLLRVLLIMLILWPVTVVSFLSIVMFLYSCCGVGSSCSAVVRFGRKVGLGLFEVRLWILVGVIGVECGWIVGCLLICVLLCGCETMMLCCCSSFSAVVMVVGEMLSDVVSVCIDGS